MCLEELAREKAKICSKMPANYNKDELEKNGNYSVQLINLIGILFAVILANGFQAFASEVDIEEFLSWDLHIEVVVVLFFLAGYYFVVMDYIFYNKQIKKFPYIRGSILRFLLDVFMFYVLYLCVYLASIKITILRLFLFTSLVALWHLLAFFWQISVTRNYGRKTLCGYSHLGKSMGYGCVGALYCLCYGVPFFSGTKSNGIADQPELFWWVLLVVAMVFAFSTFRFFVWFKGWDE